VQITRSASKGREVGVWEFEQSKRQRAEQLSTPASIDPSKQLVDDLCRDPLII
jgi:hypothetical protein